MQGGTRDGDRCFCLIGRKIPKCEFVVPCGDIDIATEIYQGVNRKFCNNCL
jgi:hypothetical protein